MKRADGGANIVMKHTNIRSADMANPIVIDLSHHNPTPNWASLKANGTVGIIHKATEGTSYVDDQLFNRARAAMDAGLKWSTYHFMRGSDINRQMDHYLATIDPVEGERVCLDHEDSATSLSELEQAVAYLLSLRPDLQITIYSGHLIKEQLGSAKNGLLAENTSLWIAQYTTASSPQWPTATWPQWSLWQYTDKASATGVSQPVDGNRWNGDEASLIAWFGPAEAIVPEPEPEPIDEPTVVLARPTWQIEGREHGDSVDIAILTLTPGVTVSVTVDGEPILLAAHG